MTVSWSPGQYLQYGEARLRPALELLARVPLDAVASIADLGCGPGNVTALLAERWPGAAIVGVDGDEAMLERARAAHSGRPGIHFERADLANWSPRERFDLVYSNAALHWLDDHATLLPQLFGRVAGGGALAVQMPDNFGAPSHLALFDTAESARWRARVGALVRRAPVAPAAQYHAWLAPLASAVDVWTTEYLQVLAARADGEHPVVAWMRGAALTPFTSALGRDAEAFVADFAGRVAPAYPALADGRVLFPFRRRFLVVLRAPPAK